MLSLFISGLKRNVSYCEMKGEKAVYILVSMVLVVLDLCDDGITVL
jgi:hypothetical protein